MVNNTNSHVVKNLSLSLPPNQVLAIVGASGSGKTVFTHSIMGILPPTATVTGEILLNNAPITPTQQTSQLTLIPQTTSYLDPLMKMGKQLPLVTNELSKKTANLYPFQCSGGMVRNALFGLAYEKGQVIIADEPTPGLDLETATKTLTQLKDMAKNGKSVLLITHDLDLAINIADKIAVFYDGTILETISNENQNSATPQTSHPYTLALFSALPQNDFQNFKLENTAENDITVTPLDSEINKKTPPTQGITLSACNLGFKYPKSPQLFSDVNFSLKQGRVTSIFAKSGFGKSTFAKLLAGYEKSTSGEITIDGNPLPKGNSQFSPVQLIYQHPEKSVNPKWNIQEILNEGGSYNPDLLDIFGITQAQLTMYPHQLSGGQLQRISIIRSLKPTTKFLICDEITTMLDPITASNIWHTLLKIAKQQNIGVLVITHNKSLAEKISNEIIDFEKLCTTC